MTLATKYYISLNFKPFHFLLKMYDSEYVVQLKINKEVAKYIEAYLKFFP